MASGTQLGAREVTLDDRYDARRGRGLPVRRPGARAGAARSAPRRPPAGLRTATLVSGYQGSPLGGPRPRARRASVTIAAEHELRPPPRRSTRSSARPRSGARSSPARCPARATTASSASGTARRRASTAPPTRSATATSSAPTRAAACSRSSATTRRRKSSTLPSASESLLAALHVPVLVPGQRPGDRSTSGATRSPARARRGLWAALKIVTNVADAAGTVEVGARPRDARRCRVLEWEGAPYVHRPSAHLLAPSRCEMERTLYGVRLELARATRGENRLNQRRHTTAPGARLGVVAAGARLPRARPGARATSASATRDRCGCSSSGCSTRSTRSRPRLRRGPRRDRRRRGEGPVPRAPRSRTRSTASRSHAARRRRARRARRPLLPATGVRSTPTRIARAIGARLLAREDLPPRARAPASELDAVADAAPIAARQPRARRTSARAARTTRRPGRAGRRDRRRRHRLSHDGDARPTAGRGNVTGHRRRWAARARSGSASRRSSTPRHFIQNLGDGTYHHSGSLAIRAAVAADLNVTYKLLYNDTVAMTGGQHVEGQLSVAEIARELAAEGVRADHRHDRGPRALRRRRAARRRRGARPRASSLASQRELAAIDGVTVLIHDQACATELRRARKRGNAPDPPQPRADQRARLRGLRRLRREVRLPVGRARRDRVRAQDADRPDDRATRTSRASTATARRS